MKRRQQWKKSRPEHRNQACRNRPAHSVALFTKCCLPVRTESYYFTSDPNIQDEKKVSSEDATGSSCSWRIGACFLCTARSLRAVPVWQLSDQVHGLQSTSPVAQLWACLWYLIHSPPEWRTRQEKKKRLSTKGYKWTQSRQLSHPGSVGEMYWFISGVYGNICSRMGNMVKDIFTCSGMGTSFWLAQDWIWTLGWWKQPVCGLLNMHCTSALAI